LPTTKLISVKAAIGDLETLGKKFVDSVDGEIKGFTQIEYQKITNPSSFISLMRKNAKGSPDSLRLPKHKAATTVRFQTIMDTCKAGQTLGEKDRARLGIKKHALTPLNSLSPSATITTLPDDIIHYSEPRVLTVRENARLQTFPDWFKFTGKYTTGGAARRHDCPRYTQVGNAVPPLFSEALGCVLKQLAS
jgi:DNA (cytosine-5)-methyltransferase 1